MPVKRLLCIVGGMNAGGAETFLMKVYRNLDKTKYQMDFAVGISEKGYYDDEICSMGGKIFHITPKGKGFIKNFIQVKNLVKSEQYEYVLRTSQHSLSALELLAAKLGGARIRVYRSSNSNTTTGDKKQLLLHKLCKFMPLIFANVRVAPSTEAAEFMFGNGCIEKGKAHILHNGIDFSFYKYDEGLREKTREKFMLADKMVVGHIGRFNQQKNHNFLLDVFNEITKSISDSVLLLVGTGELESKIKEKAKNLGISDKVIFTGVCNDVRPLLSAMDVLLFPSLYEGMPNVVIEAQAAGLPCVISATITSQADITGLVKYLPLDLSAENWANEVLTIPISDARADTRDKFYNAGYDQNSVTKEFIRLIFERDMKQYVFTKRY